MNAPERARGLRGFAAVVLLYAAIALCAFPFPETLVAGQDARHQALDVFDDGAVSRLGGLADDWKRYGWTWWNDDVTNGNAHFAQFMATPLALDSFLAWGLGPFPAYMLRLYLTVVAAGLSLHLFLRRSIGLPVVPAVAGAVVYTLGFWHYNYGFTLVLAPLVFWVGDEAADGDPARRRWLRAGAVLLCAFLFYNVSSQAAVFLAALQLGWILLTATPGYTRRSSLTFWAFSWAVGLALYAPVLLPQLALLGESVRSIRSDAGEIASLGVFLREFLEWYLPALIGIPAAVGLEVPAVLAERGTWYLGAAAVGLIVGSLLAGRRTRREKGLLILLAAIPAFDLIVRPVWIALQEHLGILRSFQPRRLNLFFPFVLGANLAVAAAAALAATRFREGRLLPRRLSLVLAAIGAIQALLAGRVLAYVLREEGGSPFEGPAFWWLVAVLYALFGAGCLLLLGRRSLLSAGRPARVAVLLLGILAVDRVVYARVERHMREGDLASFREALGETPAIRFLRERGADSGRVLTIGDHSRPNRVDHANRMMFWGLRAADGYQNIYPLRYHDLFGVLIEPTLARSEVRRRYFETWGQRAYLFGPAFDREIASLLSVRWLYVHGVAIDETGLTVAFRQGDETVYENKDALPRAFLVGGTRITTDRKALAAALSRATLPELREAVFLSKDDAGDRSEAAGHPSAGQARLREVDPDRLTVEVSTPEPAWLVVTDAFASGWEARIGETKAPILPAYGALRAVAVPAGESAVEFRYVAPEAQKGIVVAAAASTLLLVATVLPRRAPAPVPAGEAA